MKVLFFSSSFTTHDRRFLEKLSASEHEVCFLTLEAINPELAQHLPLRVHLAAKNGLKAKISKTVRTQELLPAFQSIVDEIKPDLIHAGPVQSCGYLAALSGFHPFLVMSWGSDLLVDAESSEYMREITRSTLQQADILVCDSDAVRHQAMRYTQFKDGEIIQFPWGLELESFKPSSERHEFRDRYRWPENTHIVIAARAWEDAYDPWTGIRAFLLAYQCNPRLRLVLLGGGSKASEIEQLIMRNGLNEVVYRPGSVPENHLPDFYQSADCYLSTCPNDGTSISLLQAMAAGLPVIVTNAGGNREWVVNERNGWLGDAGDAAGFSQGLLWAVGLTGEERAQISGYSRNLVREKADWNRNFQKLLDCYQKFKVIAL